MAHDPARERAFEELVRARSSVRAFASTPVTDAQVERVLELAGEAPSWSNTQPYRVAVANGPACDALRKDMLHAADTRIPEGEYPMLFEYPSPLKERRHATGYGLYAALGIAREDREGRAAQFRRNYAFFDAPCVLFLFAHEGLGDYAVLDAGLYLQTMLLAAQALGLATCAQAALAGYPDVVRAHFDVPAHHKLLCGVALGYAADAPVNAFRPARQPVSALRIPPRAP
jgi:nitroreductase